MREALSRLPWRAAMPLASLALLAWPVAAQAPALAMLGKLEKGNWTLRLRNGSQQGICVRTGDEFIQLRHRQKGCNRFVVQDSATQVVVQYTCPGDGYGRTSIRQESKNLVQIVSSGIANGAPFSVEAEARHTGSC